jgi:N-hydroxyarylamine O-acetyltransferase
MQALTPRQVQAYLSHIHSYAPQQADRANLDRLIAAQLQRVPFENVDVLLQRPILLDADSVFAKVVERGRGGYCFEINSLFARLLLSFGYRVSLLGARVRWGLADDAPTSMLSHLLLRIELSEGSFIVDIGFGGPTPTGAMPLEARDSVSTFPYRLQAPRGAQALYQMQAQQNGQWQTMYQFDLQPQVWIDHIARSWYTATHPESIFLNNLMCARSQGVQRLSLSNRNFSRRHPDGRVEQHPIASAKQLVELLIEAFALNLDPITDSPALQQCLQQLLQFDPCG